MPSIAQPNAESLDESIVEEVLGCLSLGRECDVDAVVREDRFSNDYAEVRLRSGRSVVIKRGRFAWSKNRFEASRAASLMIRRSSDIVVPAPIVVPRLVEEPVEAYWRIDLPTLLELWPRIGRAERPRVLEGVGALTGRLHAIETDGYGRLADGRGEYETLEEFLEAELVDRLLPAVYGQWPAAAPSIERVADVVARVGARVSGRSRLLHGDLHMGNVLCERRGGDARCVGLIDLETAQAGPPEADIAVMEVHHGPLFDHPLPGDWIRFVGEGYTHEIDPWVVNFYRAYHLLNMGFYSALIGHDWHAARVAEAVEVEVASLLAGK